MFGQIFSLLKTIWGNPTLLWMTIFIVAGLVTGVISGFFRRRKVQPGVWRWKAFGIEAATFAVGPLLNAVFLGTLMKLLNSRGLLTYNPAHAAWWVIAAEYAVFFVLFDTWFYWWHRLMHIEPIYTVVHRWHHFSTTPNMLSTFSVTPFESLINGGFMPLFTVVPFLLGYPIHKQTGPFIGITVVLMGLYVHTGYEFLPKWWNKSWATKWFITATFHDQHHQFFKYNYGGFTTVWDRICGTMRSKYEHDFENPRALRREQERRRAKAQARATATAATATATADLQPS